MTAVARFGDEGSHGGTIITASGDSTCNGLGIARQGDILDCAQHGHQAINAITTHTLVNNRLVITVGATADCGAVIITGSPDTSVE
jgi:uncharacterized Zn-binding protein involved in type VI secretion